MGACEHGAPWASCKKLHKTMTRQQMHDFAATPTKGLPQKLSGKAKKGRFG